MATFSVLLIENQISDAASIVESIDQHLTSYKLSVVRDVPEAIAAQEPANVILLDMPNEPDEIAHVLSLLTTAYPDAVIILLVSTALTDANKDYEDMLLAALTAGAHDFVPMSHTGLLALGRRLGNLRRAASTPAPIDQSLLSVISDHESELIVQLIGSDDQISIWNRAAEAFFGLKEKDIRGVQIKDLPLSPNNLSRLKDIIDQARATGRPFFVPTYPIENYENQVCWARAYVFPISQTSTTSGSRHGAEVCIISADVTDFKAVEILNRRHNQELQVLLEISRQMSGQLELGATLERIVDQAKSLLNADNCQVYLSEDSQTLRPLISIGPHAEQIQEMLFTSHLSDVIATTLGSKGRIINFVAPENVTAIEHDANEIHDSKVVHILCAPLSTSNQPLCVMVARRSHKPAFTKGDLFFFEGLVQQASSAIHNARLFEETQESLAELSTLYEASTTIATKWNIKEVLNSLVKQMVQATGVSQGHIVSWNKHQHYGLVEAVYLTDEDGARSTRLQWGYRFDLAQRPSLLTVTKHQRVVLFELSNPSLDPTERQDMEEYGCLARLLAPLVIKGETIGWAELWETRSERKFTIDEIRLTRLLSNQAAMALKNAQHLQQMRQTLDETTALYQVASALAKTQDPQNIMSIVLQEYLRVLELKQGRVIIFDFEAKAGTVKINLRDSESALSSENGKHEAESALTGLEGQQFSLKNNPLFEQLMRSYQPVVVEDTHAPHFNASRAATAPVTPIAGSWAGTEAISTLVIPINIREEIIGAIVVEATRQTRSFDTWEISLGQAMADQLGIALQNVQLYELETQRRQQAETLRDVSAAVGSSLKLNEVLERILEQLNQMIHYDGASIHLIEGNQRKIIAGRGFPKPEQVIGLTFPAKLTEDEPGSIVIHKRQPLMIGNIQEVYGSFTAPPHDRIKSWMGIPLIARDKVIGIITIDRTVINAFSPADITLAQAFANQVAIALENARLYEIEVREIERELEIAHEIQETLLPQFTPQVPHLQIAGRTFPMRQIGGDFFHFFSTDQEHFGVAIGDVSGKGIPAALYMAAAITAIDTEISKHQNTGPGQLLNDLHQILYRRLQSNRMNVGLQVATFTALPLPAGSILKESAGGKIMTIANAGMIAPFIASEYGCHLLPIGGLPLGAPVQDPEYPEEKVLLEPGTAVIFMSDGIIEARNEAGNLFSFERLEQTLSEIIHTQDAEMIAEHIIFKAQEFMDSSEPSDDMTVVVIVIK